MGLPADAGAHGPPPGTADVLYSSSMDGASISYDLDRVLVLSLERFLRGRRGVWLVLRVSHMPEVKGKRNVRQHTIPFAGAATEPSAPRMGTPRTRAGPALAASRLYALVVGDGMGILAPWDCRDGVRGRSMVCNWQMLVARGAGPLAWHDLPEADAYH